MGRYTFRKEERLNKEKMIQELFKKGSSFYLFPFKVLLLPNPGEKQHQILITVSKRNFKKAVDRNRIKRQIREVYRLQKELLPTHSILAIGFIYTQKELPSYPHLHKRMRDILKKIAKLTGALSSAS